MSEADTSDPWTHESPIMNKWLFLSLLLFLLLTPIQGHSLWCLSTVHNRLAVYYRAHTDKHTTHSHSSRQFLAYISLDCEQKLRRNPDKYSSCKLQRPRFKPSTVQTTEPLQHPHKQIMYKYSNNLILSVSMLVWGTFIKSEDFLVGKQPLALPQVKSPPVCVYFEHPRLTVMVPQVSEEVN